MGRFRASYAGIGEVLTSDGVRGDLHARAERVKAAAVADAPYDEHSTDGSHYRDSFSVSSGVREGRSRRAYGRVENTDPAAFYIEFGTKHTPAHHTLTRALDAAKD